LFFYFILFFIIEIVIENSNNNEQIENEQNITIDANKKKRNRDEFLKLTDNEIINKKFKKNDLEGLRKDNLKKILKKKKIYFKCSLSLKNLADVIIKNKEMDVLNKKKLMKQSIFPGNTAVHHELYVKNFNTIDLIDKKAAEVSYKLKNFNFFLFFNFIF
jgi:hypothetical protein